MKSYIILGLGKFGQSMAKTLVELGHEVLGVDRQEKIIQELSSILTHVIQADTTNEDVLKSLGVNSFDAAVVAIGDDVQASILTTVLLKEHGVKYIIAKAHNELHAKVLYKVGADKVVFPEKDMGIRAAYYLSTGTVLDMMELSPDISIAELSAPSDWVGKTLGELQVRQKHKATIMAVSRQNEIDITLTGDFLIHAGDTLIVLGKNIDIQKLRDER